jgi:HAD superfamily hydrolase (TIGR01450 family)
MTLSGAIVDLDGTVYRGDHLLPGASSALDRLRAAGLSLLFFSNNPTKDGRAYASHLSELGVDVHPDEACSAGVVTTEYLRGNHADDEVMLIGSAGLRDQLSAADITLTTDPDATDVLVGSWTPAFDYEDMHTALRTVDEGTTFLGTDPDRWVPQADGDRMPGSGAIINSLAATVGREPDAVLGKPSDAALELALERLGVPAEECLVVGDRLDTDLRMGDRAGMTTVLVLTGVCDRADVARSDVDPDFVIDGLDAIDEVLAAVE